MTKKPAKKNADLSPLGGEFTPKNPELYVDRRVELAAELFELGRKVAAACEEAAGMKLMVEFILNRHPADGKFYVSTQCMVPILANPHTRHE